MAITMKALKGKVSTVTVDWDDEQVEVGYKPGEMTPGLIETVQEAAKAENLDVLGVMLEPILEWWDILDEDGERLPTDRDTIKTIPITFLTRIMSVTQEAMRPPGGKG